MLELVYTSISIKYWKFLQNLPVLFQQGLGTDQHIHLLQVFYLIQGFAHNRPETFA